MEKQTFVDQRRQAAVDRFLADHRDALARQGTIVTTWRQRSGRRLGPYFRLTCREQAGRQLSVYLGPPGPLVDAVRLELSALKAALTCERAINAARHQLRQELKNSQAVFDEELAGVGLWRKGSEVRGWQSRGHSGSSAARQPTTPTREL